MGMKPQHFEEIIMGKLIDLSDIVTFQLDDKTITANIGWEADEKRDSWELCGSVAISDAEKALYSKWYRPDYYELQHLESVWPEDIYRQLQQEGFLGWKKELPSSNRGGWGAFYSNTRAAKNAQQADKNRLKEAVSAIGVSAELCKSHIDALVRIVQLINELKEKRPTVSAREHYFG